MAERPRPGALAHLRRVDMPQQALLTLGVTMSVTVIATTALAATATVDAVPIITAVCAWLIIGALILHGLPRAVRVSDGFGLANTVTTIRTGATVLLAAFIPVAAQLDTHVWWILSTVAILALLLDGVDGYLARSRDESTAFGARFDMEIDALLALVMSLLLWQSGELGVWILGLGVLRYVFIGASMIWPALDKPLYPSMRRKAVCVVQVATLGILLTPVITGAWAVALGLAALIGLVWSFVRDTQWLLSR